MNKNSALAVKRPHHYFNWRHHTANFLTLISDDEMRSSNLYFFAGTSPSACTPACSDRPTCGNCTGGLCMWCKNLNMCIDRNAYLASFPYGQCMDWTTKADECPLAPNKNDSKVKNT